MIQAIVILAVMGGIFGAVLAVASKRLAVETDPRVDEIIAVLPGANCGACGFPGCSGLANAIVHEGAPVNACVPGKDKVAAEVAKIMGIEASTGGIRKVAQLHCNGTFGNTKPLYEYKGVMDCHLAVTQFGGPSYCYYGCIGLGSCERVCPFDAIHIGDNRLPVVDNSACVGCGICANQCPQKILQIVPIDKRVHVRCNTRDKGKKAMDTCKVSCISCGICVKNCPEGAITLLESKAGSVAVIDYDKCTGCGICVEKCPRKSIHLDPPIDPELTPCERPKEPEGCAACAAKNVCGLH